MTEETRNRLFVLDTILGVSFFLGYFIFGQAKKKYLAAKRRKRS